MSRNVAAAPREDTVLQSEVLESLASAVRYRDWLTALARPWLGDDPIELGSGFGDYALTWLAAGLPRITVTEIESARLQALHERFDGDPRVEVAAIDVRAPESRAHSALVAFNVLEHIEDDVGALRAAHTLLRPGGKVVMFVPAFEFAAGRYDREVGHHRRYTVATLRAAFTAAGLDVESIRYVNAPGLLAWFLLVRVLGRRPDVGPLMRGWDRFLVPMIRAVESRLAPPFGQSVFAAGAIPGRGRSAA